MPENDAEVWACAHPKQWTHLTDDAACLATCLYGINRTLVRIAVELERANEITLSRK